MGENSAAINSYIVKNRPAVYGGAMKCRRAVGKNDPREPRRNSAAALPQYFRRIVRQKQCCRAAAK